MPFILAKTYNGLNFERSGLVDWVPLHAETKEAAIAEALEVVLDGCEITDYNPHVWLNCYGDIAIWEVGEVFSAGVLEARDQWKVDYAAQQAEREKRRRQYLELKKEFDP